jgi:hypothetical protein
VLLAFLQDDEDRDKRVVSMLNAATGENFEILVSEDSWSMSWEQTESGLDLRLYNPLGSGKNPDHYYLHQVNVTTGEERQLPLSTIYGRGFLSPDGRFAAQTIGEPGAESVVIIDQESGQEITLDDPFDGRYPDDIDISWSVDSTLLALRFLDKDEINYGPPSIGLAIYTPDGRIYRTYFDVWNWDWAADGSYQILTVEGDNFGNDMPCVLDLQTNTTDCLVEVSVWRENGIENTGYYEWLPDGSGISFLYWDRSNRQAGLCIFELTSRIITCPINETHIFSAAIGPEVGGFPYLIEHKWSPDGRYIALAIDPFGPESDDRTLTQVATIARDGSQFHLWGFGGLWDAEWRPLIEIPG